MTTYAKLALETKACPDTRCEDDPRALDAFMRFASSTMIFIQVFFHHDFAHVRF